MKLISREETDMILTERELTLIIEELEVNKEVYEQMIREERERGREPYPRHLEVLNLLEKLKGVQV
jgi:iron only hydrogenase large subunit-like protein